VWGKKTGATQIASIIKKGTEGCFITVELTGSPEKAIVVENICRDIKEIRGGIHFQTGRKCHGLRGEITC